MKYKEKSIGFKLASKMKYIAGLHSVICLWNLLSKKPAQVFFLYYPLNWPIYKFIWQVLKNMFWIYSIKSLYSETWAYIACMLWINISVVVNCWLFIWNNNWLVNWKYVSCFESVWGFKTFSWVIWEVLTQTWQKIK